MSNKSVKRVNNTYCSVFGCSSKKSKDSSIHFHQFPKKNAQLVNITTVNGVVQRVDKRSAWETVLKYSKPVSQYMLVCSLHFTPNDYVNREGELDCSA